MSVISMKQLLEAGVHFGHQTRRWNPKMAPYIYTERNGIYIIDLQKSVGMVDDAYKAVADIAADGGTILFVGTKKQAQDAIAVEAERCGMYYVNERWLGGMLTNFKTIQSRIARLKAIGFRCCLISNNQKPRVEMFNKDIQVDYVYNAHKPSTRNYLRAMEIMGTDRRSSVFIGDQLFTDVWGAKRAGIPNILVKPIHPKEEIQIVLKRYLEKIVLHFYKKSLQCEKKVEK